MPKKPPPKADDGASFEVPDVERHDAVYFRHASGPLAGKVLSRGAHGCTVDVDGQRHKVRWGDFLGHKSKVSPQARVIDQGDDGLIVEHGGARRFVRDPMGVVERDEPLTKAGPTVLFFGAAEDLLKAYGARNIKNRPGLTLQVVSDRTGHQTKRWKKTGNEAPAHKKNGLGAHNVSSGHHVKFKAGSFEGEGHVVGEPGNDGAHVKDATGREHRIHYHEMTHHQGREVAAGEGMAAASEGAEGRGRPGGGGGGDGGEGGGRSLFDPADLRGLPAAASQPHETWEDLVKHGEEGLGQFKEALDKVAASLGLKTLPSAKAMTDDALESPEGFLLVAPLKSAERSKVKVEADYDGDWSQLRDLVRATIAVSTMDDLHSAIAAVKGAGIELAQIPKDRFAKPTYEGYRDLLTVVKLPNGMLAELQFNVKAMIVAKTEGHKGYETARTLRAKYGDPAPTDAWSAEDHQAFYDALKAQREVYGAAWKKVQSLKENPGKTGLEG